MQVPGTRQVVLTRRGSSPTAPTFGDWVSDSGFKCVTLEKPDRNNAPDVSCIPKGVYQVLWLYSAAHGCNLYHVMDVPGRSAIEIHGANVQEQLLGCIAPGAAVEAFAAGSCGLNLPPQDEDGVTDSRETLAALEADLRDAAGNQAAFTLTIQ